MVVLRPVCREMEPTNGKENLKNEVHFDGTEQVDYNSDERISPETLTKKVRLITDQAED